MNMNTSQFDINWGGDGYAAYDGNMSTAAVTPTPGAAPASAPPAAAPAAAPTATPSAEKPASPAGGPSGASPSPTSNDANLKELREGYERYKSLGDYETVSEHASYGQKMWSEAETLGKSLGYKAEEVKEAFKTDPVETLKLLRADKKALDGKAARPGTPENIQKMVRDEMERANAPLREQQAREHAERTMNGFMSETAAFINADIPDLQKDAPQAYTLYGEIACAVLDRHLSSDPKLLQAYLNGKASGLVKKAHAEAKEIFNAAVNQYQALQLKKGGGKPAAGGEEKPKFSLQDAIDGNDNAVKHLSSMRQR